MIIASSGSFNTGGYEGRYLVFSWTEQDQNITNNTTKISWTLKGAGVAQATWYMAGNFKVTIAGETVYSSATRIQLKNGTTVASGTYTFTHNNDGTKTFTAYAEAGIYNYAVNCTGSQTFTLDTIARKSTLTASDGTLGIVQILTVSRQSSSLTHTITYKCGTATGTIVTKSTSTSINWTPPMSLATQNTTGVSISLTFTITTYSGSTSIGFNTKTITCAIPASVKPTCSISVSDAMGYKTTYGAYIKGLSKFKIVVNAVESYGSNIASYMVNANGAKYTAANVTTDVLQTYGQLTISAIVTDKRSRSGATSIRETVIDYNAPIISKFKVLRCNSDGTANDQGEYIKVIFSYIVTGLNNKNSVICKLNYKKSTVTNYTTITFSTLTDVYTTNDYSYIFPADSGSSYNVAVSVEDDFNTVKRSTRASTAFTIMNWRADGTSIGIGKVAEKANTLQVGLNAEFESGVIYRDKELWEFIYPVGTIVHRYDNTNPADLWGGTWEILGENPIAVWRRIE